MPPTVEEILKASGLTDEQVKALDAKVTAGFTQVLSAAIAAQEKAEFEHRAQTDAYDQQIAPALNNWANEKAAQDTKMAAYDAALKAAVEGGFQVPDILKANATATTTTATTTQRNDAGQFVAGRNAVPGSPQYMTREEGFRVATAGQWYVTEYMRLHNGAPPPVDFDTVADEAAKQRMDFRAYVEKRFDYQLKRDKIKADEQKKHDDAIIHETEARKDREWAEKVGNNPNIRVAQTSAFSTIDTAVKAGERKDPLSMTREQRHAQTQKAIQKDVAEHANERVQ